MNLQDIKENEYDAQLFGFTLQDLVVAVRNIVNETVTHFTDVMTTKLVKKYADDLEVERFKEIKKLLIDQYMDVSVDSLKTLEAQLKELFHIPRHVLLPEDTIQKTQYSSTEEQEVDNQIEELMLKIKRTKSFDMELHQELKMLRDTLPLLTRLVRDSERLVAERNKSEEILTALMPSIEKMVTNQLLLLNLDKYS